MQFTVCFGKQNKPHWVRQGSYKRLLNPKIIKTKNLQENLTKIKNFRVIQEKSLENVEFDNKYRLFVELFISLRHFRNLF